ncbi:MAG: tRNA 2-selenouridine synthase [Yoonia sp.]|jgi:tRNA 2-selenouridine synthase
MSQTFDSIRAMLTHGFDTVIDVRSPAEFAVDHVPGAINLPALSNDQRAQVGTMYKQISPFDARKLGATLVARNVADHVEGPLADHDGSWQPLIYCWRGGQRSGSFTMILQQIGWRADIVNGGYMQWRRLVKEALYDNPLPHRFVLLDGNTGTAKTAILARLAAMDVQVIDLEGLAGHRGSSLGAVAGGQPDQKGFETALAVALDACDPSRPIVVEAESSRIGQINLPPQLWAKMIVAPRIMIEAPIDARAAFLETAYADMIADPSELAARFAPLRSIRGHAVVDGWLALLEARKFRALAKALMEQHYDAAYAKSRGSEVRASVATVAVNTLDNIGQDDAVRQIMQALIAL